MAAVVVAGAVFVLTNGDEPDTVVRASASTASSSTPTTSAPATPSAKRPTRHRPPVRRSGTYVEVFNNSGISGLAGSTAARAQGAGWQVVGSDNWYGTIPASTVYYPARLHRQAVLLAKDLGIARLKPSIAPMGGDRLTVILTRDYL
jgi:hypothetical protein